MRTRLRWIHGWVVGAGLLWPGAVLADGPCCGLKGCGWFGFRGGCLNIDNCASVPPGAQPAPNGYYVNRIIQTQQGIAESDDFVIYKNMWFRGGKELGPLGRYQLDTIARRLATVPFPVIVATSKNDRLDEERRQIILNLLALRGYSDPSRVVIAYPIAEGLFGDETEPLYQGFLLGSRGFGQGGGGGGFGGGGGIPTFFGGGGGGRGF